MAKLLMAVGTVVGGYAGWIFADKLGFGILTAYFVSGLGSMVGLYGGWKLAKMWGDS